MLALILKKRKIIAIPEKSRVKINMVETGEKYQNY